MSLFGLYKNAHAPTRRDVDDALSGNLCRCTGYRPILAAAERMYDFSATEGWRGPGVAADGSRLRSVDEERIAAQLESLAEPDGLEYEADGRKWFAPRTLDALAAVCAANPAARIVAGATDVGLWITKQHRDLGDIIHVGDCGDLKSLRDADDALDIGAGVYARRRVRGARRRVAGACARHGFASRRCRSATAARWAATSPTVRRSATRCRR